jgi:hypothetical protein
MEAEATNVPRKDITEATVRWGVGEAHSSEEAG